MTKLKITNHTDIENCRQGHIAPEAIRSVEIDALVDTGATTLALPEDVVKQVGGVFAGIRKVRDARGIVVDFPWVAGLRIEILGREMTCDALVIPTGATPLIGQIPLEGLDLIVDPRSREARVNPESPEAPLLDLMHVA
ncbi:MAG: hypothetical protein R3B13_35985 [Polyangiaceae bacterium]